MRNADENVLGADRMKKTLRLGTGSTVSKDIDDEMRALKNRSFNQFLSLPCSLAVSFPRTFTIFTF